ncbi:MAG: MarR family winged helix-turn-helix transcriptional regulator [Thermodesulfobacteriota bacterium]|jgi:DNA-binding MarR family transcriptional regulator
MSRLHCYELRKTSRYVINFYDNALKGSKLKSNQFIILVSVAYLKSPNFKTLAEFVGIDQSTLARNLITFEKQNLVSVKTGKNRREKIITLSRKGDQKLMKAFPLWRKAQSRLVGEFGGERWKHAQKDLNDITSLTKSLGQS